MQMAEANSLCFGPSDCFLVQWGTEDQFEAELIYGWREPAKRNGNTSYVIETGRPGLYGPKSVNLEVTFVVARNATNANLCFGEHKIPLNLEGNRSLSARNSPLLPAPAPALSQDAKTANFFINGQRGIAVTGVYHEFEAESTVGYRTMVDLEVLSLGDYAETDAEDGPNTGSGGVCFGKRGSECLEVLWGPETRFNAILSLDDGEAKAFAVARGRPVAPAPHRLVHCPAQPGRRRTEVRGTQQPRGPAGNDRRPRL